MSIASPPLPSPLLPTPSPLTRASVVFLKGLTTTVYLTNVQARCIYEIVEGMRVELHDAE